MITRIGPIAVLAAVLTACEVSSQDSIPQRTPAGRIPPQAAKRREQTTNRGRPNPANHPPSNASPRLAQLPQQTGNGGMPPEYQLSTEAQQRVDAILRVWEHYTSTISTFQCSFTRNEFDPVFGPQDKKLPLTISKGTIRFAAPDKGILRADSVWKYQAPQKEGDRTYQKQDVEFGEYWVCDGKSVYEFDSRTKLLTERRLPPELQGKAISEGPLPFLFGAKAETMKKRYWIREVTPIPNPNGQYWLEAMPKPEAGGADFERLIVILERRGKDHVLPTAIRVIHRTQQLGQGKSYVDYKFENQRVNDVRDRVADFLKAFVDPDTPAGWTKDVRDWNDQRIHQPIVQPGQQNRTQQARSSTATSPVR